MSVKRIFPAWGNDPLRNLVQSGKRALTWAGRLLVKNHARPVFSFITAALAGGFTGFTATQFPCLNSSVTYSALSGASSGATMR